METEQSPSSSTTTLVPNETDGGAVAGAGSGAVTVTVAGGTVSSAVVSGAGVIGTLTLKTLNNTNTINTTTTTTTTAIISPRTAAAAAASGNSGPDMPQLGLGLSPQPVGREFVRQYYTVMSKSPQMLHRFYAANSTLTFCNSPTIVGQEQIRKDIEKRGLRDCHTRIFKIDAQPTLANGVVVQVVGELSNNNEPLRSFTQTFVLTPLVPKNFFVHNEIFRYQDDLQAEVCLDPLKIDHAIGAVTGYMTAPAELWLPSATIRAFSPVLTRQVIAISKSIASIAIQTANETALKGERETVAVPQALQVEVVVQPLKTAAETQTPIELPTIAIPTQSQPTTPPQIPANTVQTPATATATTTATAPRVCKSDATIHQVPEAVEVTNKAADIPVSKVAEKSQTASTSTAKITTPAPPIPISPPAPPPTAALSIAPPLVTPALTYANVFKSSSTQSLSAPKPTPPPPLPDCELNCEISTTYIPSATFTTSTSGNSSPAPNAIDGRLTATSPIPPIPEMKTTTNVLPESSNSIAQNANNQQSTTLSATSSNQTELRNKNRYETTRNRYDAGATRNVRNNNNSNSNNTFNTSSNSSYQTQRRPRQQYDRYDDNLQLFLGNLPLTATVEDLTQMFERYGSILELRVLSKSSQPGQRKLPNYGFLTFATTEAVERCLNDLPFYYPENSDKSVRLNVRPKNETAIGSQQQQQHQQQQHQQQQQQQQQPTRTGKYNFRYDNGGDQIRSTDQSRYRRFIKRGTQEPQNGGGEASNVAANSRSSPVTVVPTVRDDWPELSAASSGGGTYRRGNKK